MLTKFTRAVALVLLAGGLATATPALAQTKLTFGASAGVTTAVQPLYYALNAGLFKKRGLDVEIVKMTDDTTATLSFVSGAFDMLFTGAAPALVAISHGAAIKLVSSTGPRSDYQLVAQKSINTLKELEGKSLAVSKIGAVGYVAPVYVLKKAGVDVSKVHFIALGTDASRGQALVAGTVDASALTGVQAILSLKNGPNLHIIADIGSQFSNFLFTAIFASSAAIKQKHDAVAAAVDAMIEASRTLQSDEATAVKLAVSLGLPEDSIKANYDTLLASDVPYWGVNGGLAKPAVEAAWDSLKADGSIQSDFNFDTVTDMSFVDQSMKKIGPYTKP
jgi:NitT/TauT family transport system substrate-binding protein